MLECIWEGCSSGGEQHVRPQLRSDDVYEGAQEHGADADLGEEGGGKGNGGEGEGRTYREAGNEATFAGVALANAYPGYEG